MIEDLKDAPLLKGLSAEELAAIQGCFSEKTFQKGDMLLFEGDACESVFIVQSGRVKLYRTSAAGREQIVEVIGPGGTPACNPGNAVWNCIFNAQALTPCQVWYLKRDDYVDLIRTNTKVSRSLNEIFAKRLCHFGSLLEQVGLMNVKKRLAKFLLDMHTERAQKKGETGVVFLPFTRDEVAKRLGTARETIARQLSQLKRDGLIEIDEQRIELRNLSALEKLVSE